MAAEGRGPVMHSRIGVLRALNRNIERVFTDRKDLHWGKRKLNADIRREITLGVWGAGAQTAQAV